MKDKIDFDKAYGCIIIGDAQYIKASEKDDWQEFLTVADDLESNDKEKKPKDYKLITAILVITNIFTIILFTIAVMFYKDCYNEMNRLSQEVFEKEMEIIGLKDENDVLNDVVKNYQDWISNKGWLEGDYTYCENGECKNFNEETTCKWYERFYDEFHEEVGAYE